MANMPFKIQIASYLNWIRYLFFLSHNFANSNSFQLARKIYPQPTVFWSFMSRWHRISGKHLYGDSRDTRPWCLRAKFYPDKGVVLFPGKYCRTDHNPCTSEMSTIQPSALPQGNNPVVERTKYETKTYSDTLYNNHITLGTWSL